MAGKGAPIGNDYALKSQPWRNALTRAMVQDNGVKLRRAAEQLLDLAAAGEPWAVREIADRLDGKAAQSVTLANDVDNPLIQHLDTSRLSVEQLATIAAIKISKE